MNPIFETTKSFDKDLRKFDNTLQNKISNKINNLASLYANNINDFNSQVVPSPIKLLKGFESSLYSYRVDQRIRLLFSVDEDPLFDQLIITLFRVIRHDDYNKVFNSLRESLYQEYLSIIRDNFSDEN
jgi:mRNA-degrading endonuclease RelE of RelBE toxin-antitoxin system